MTKEMLHTSIDVGTSKICTLVSRLTSQGVIELLGVGMSRSLGLKKGVVVNIEEARESIRASVNEAARASLTNSHHAVLGVTGSHLEMSTRWGMIKSPFYNAPLTAEVIQESIESARPQGLPPEKQILHLVPQTYSVDGLKGVRNPMGMHALRLDVETFCIVGGRTPIQNLIHSVENPGIQTKSLVMSGIAAGEACLTRDEKEMGVVLIDLGAGVTTITMFRNGSIVNAAVLPVGGHQFTTDLAVALNTPYDVAEELKLRHGQANAEDIGEERVEVQAFGDRRTVKVEKRLVCQYLKDRSEEVMHLAHMKVKDFGAIAMPVAGLVLTGGVANLPGIDKVARQVFNVPARIGVPEGLNDLPDGMNDPSYTTSVGILLWGMRRPESNLGIREYKNGRSNGLYSHNGNDGPLRWFKDKVRRVAS